MKSNRRKYTSTTAHKARPKSATHQSTRLGNSLSMHANVPDWCDCCSCEAEPYWVEAMAEFESNHANDQK